MKKTRKELLEAILKKRVYIILIAVIFAITAICYTLTNVEGVATRKILLKSSENMSTYKELIDGSEVLGSVIENLDLSKSVQELEKAVEVKDVDDTNMLEIRVTGKDSQELKVILDEILDTFKDRVEEIYGNVEIFDVDNSANYYTKGNSILAGLIFLILGGGLSIILFAVMFLLDNKIKSCSQIEEITEIKTLISIPYMKSIANKKLNLNNIKPRKGDTFKTLMTNIQFLNLDNLQSKTILITSPKASEGKTYVATNLAMEFAKAGKKVILIDADMNRGRIAKIFNLPNELGLSNYLSNLDSNGNAISERIASFINDTEIKYLNIITSGNTPPNPLELLKQDKIQTFIKDLKVFYDIIIFDTVSILESQEAKVLSGLCDLTLMMSSYGDTKIGDLSKAYQEIKDIEGSIIGMGLNKIREKRVSKRLISFQNRIKIRIRKIWKKIDFEKLKSSFGNVKKIKIVFEAIAEKFIEVCITVKDGLKKLGHIIKTKLQKVKEHMKNRRQAKKEEIKLIDGEFEEEPEVNIVKEVFENELANDLEIEKPVEIIEPVEVEKPTYIAPVSEISDKKVKTKFDLMREQQEKGIIISNKVEQELKKQTSKIPLAMEKKKIVLKAKQNNDETNQEVSKTREQLIEEQRKAREEKERKKLVKSDGKKIKDVNFIDAEVITEDMIKRQVEIDDMSRETEQEPEEEKQYQKTQKLIKKAEKRRARELKKELKIRLKENKDAIKQKNRKRRIDEARVKEDLQEDNLYPRIRI